MSPLDAQWPVSEWTVMVEAEAPDGERPTVPLAAVSRFSDLLVEHLGVVGAGRGCWEARVIVEAPTAGAALEVAADVVQPAAESAGLPPWLFVRVEILRGAQSRP